MLAALVVGALTAWYLGMRAGVIAAIVTFGALLVSAFVPGLTLAVYALVLAWSAALYFLGAKLSKKTPGAGLGGAVSLVNQAQSWIRKTLGKS
ncbi:MAG: hypothetical protein SFX73_31935 [Kofleriaceae bacterium]|nr:hypothetical protein [Kofleriaceae bacterium]